MPELADCVYLRESRWRNKDGTVVSYLQLARPEVGQAIRRVAAGRRLDGEAAEG